jgi:hypothetical protein
VSGEAREGISREEIHRDLILRVDLDYADTQIGKRALPLGIPIYRTALYTPSLGLSDKYEALRKWYRKNLETYSDLIIIHRRDLQHSLSKAQPDSVDYLTIENEAEREKHEGWSELENEAIEVAQWIFPANAINRAVAAPDFIFENIKVVVLKEGVVINEIYYFLKPGEHALFYSHHQKPTT